MFLRGRKQQLPSYIEGTQGRYVRRASPPPVPSLTSHPIVKRSTTSGADIKNNNISGSSTAISSLHSQSSQEIISLNDNEDAIRRTSINFPTRPDYPLVKRKVEVKRAKSAVERRLTNSQQKQPNFATMTLDSPVHLSFQGYIPAEPSYSSSTLFNQPSTTRHLVVHENRFELDDGKRSPQPGALSSHSFSDPRREHHRKPLTTSHSIGNVESFIDHLDPIVAAPSAHSQQRFVSLQSLPGRSTLGSSIIGDECLISGSTQQEDLPLPPNWAIDVTPEGLRYFVDHTNRRTHWIHPLAHENLTVGWRKMFSEKSGVLYYNELDGRSQVEHPGFSAPISRTESMLTASRRTESAVENLNIIQQEEIPEWLMIYSEADTGLDHLLEWGLFPTLQLEQFERMMRKLYKQEVIDTVRRYERMRTVLSKEIVRRTQPRASLVNS